MFKHFAPFIIALGLFLIAEGAVNSAPISGYLDRSISNHLSQKTAQLEHDNPTQMDVLFLGTSRTGAGFKTSLFEEDSGHALNAFNLGFQDSDYYFFKLVLDQHIKRYGKPKLVLIEAADFLLNSQRLSQQEIVYFHHMMLKNPAALWEILSTPELSLADKRETLLAHFSGLYRYCALLSVNGKLSETLMHCSASLPAEEVYQGWEVKTVQPAMASAEQRKEISIARIHNLFQGFEQVDERKLDAFILSCTQQNIPVALVKWPTLKEYQQAARNQVPKFMALDPIFRAKAQASNIPWIDLSLPLSGNDPNNLFADSDHLNPRGAQVYTHRLYQVMRADPVLKHSLLKD